MTDKTDYAAGEPTWLDLGTPDLDASIAFYGGLFGWTAEKGAPEFGGYTNFSKDGKKVAGLMPLMSPEQPAVWSIYIRVDDAEKTAALVEEHGGATYAPPMDVGTLGRMAVFADPAGAALGVWQAGDHRGAESVESEGTFAWAELSTRDRTAALPFYSAVFGWQPHAMEGYTELQIEGTSVAGCMDMPPGVPAEVPSHWLPYFAAADPESSAQRAVASGATVLVPLTDFPGGRFTIVSDPHGSAFGLLDLKR